MTIRLENAGKRYRMEWVFRRIDFTFEAAGRYAVLGPNGSGKSTLLKTLSGFLSLSRGKILHLEGDRPIPRESLYRSVSLAAPYVDLIEEFTLWESIRFHERFKPFLHGWTGTDVLNLLPFAQQKDKQVRYFSSGMKQRLKLALALCSDSSLILLDEPGTNLDAQGQEWYHQLVDQLAGNRLLIVASNVEADVSFCDQRLNILDYKRMNG
ncbi:MAG: ABC transporter ATP-binding protein [Saprospirales bacterium]|nr:ABC transporter ATP-binding protein [Saprospirales bacterium]MBK8490567.1 ABC transporter ATP-binding protein [Saprospirales bacterium]